jgi:hypothetical protein
MVLGRMQVFAVVKWYTYSLLIRKVVHILIIKSGGIARIEFVRRSEAVSATISTVPTAATNSPASAIRGQSELCTK